MFQDQCFSLQIEYMDPRSLPLLPEVRFLCYRKALLVFERSSLSWELLRICTDISGNCAMLSTTGNQTGSDNL